MMCGVSTLSFPRLRKVSSSKCFIQYEQINTYCQTFKHHQNETVLRALGQQTVNFSTAEPVSVSSVRLLLLYLRRQGITTTDVSQTSCKPSPFKCYWTPNNYFSCEPLKAFLNLYCPHALLNCYSSTQ